MSIVFVFLVIENIIERYIPLIVYFDEIFTIICFGLCIYKVIIKKSINKKNIKILSCLKITIISALLGNFIYHYQSNSIAIIKDILAISKFFIIYIYSSEYIKIKKTKQQIQIIMSFSKIFIVFLFILSIINQFIDIGMDTGYRGLIKTFSFLYSHTTFLVAPVVVICTLFIAEGRKKNFIFIILSMIVMISTMRTKAFIYIICLIVLNLVIKYYRQGTINIINLQRYKKRLYFTGLILVIIVYIFGREKINSYISWGLTAARPALYIVGFKILLNCFPIGSGFATFASSLSGEYRSPLYAKYGIARTSGLVISEGYKYMADTYWPYIYSQTGIIGSLFYLYALWLVFKDCYNRYIFNSECILGFITLFIYVLAGCFVESIMTNSTVVLLAMTLGYYLRMFNKYEKL